MKYLLICLSLLFFSCTKNTNFIEWKIHQIGENAGGGPIYIDTESNKTIRFYQDDSAEILNGDWCSIRDHEGSNTGTVDNIMNKIETSCGSKSFSISSENILYFQYPGIETSYESYKRSN